MYSPLVMSNIFISGYVFEILILSHRVLFWKHLSSILFSISLLLTLLNIFVVNVSLLNININYFFFFLLSLLVFQQEEICNVFLLWKISSIHKRGEQWMSLCFQKNQFPPIWIILRQEFFTFGRTNSSDFYCRWEQPKKRKKLMLILKMFFILCLY